MTPPRPLKSGESSARNWEQINSHGAMAADARNIGSQLRYREGRPKMRAGEVLHPFKIYQPPWEFVDGIDWTTFWRTFRIRAGMVMGTDATGTDAATDSVPNADPDALYYPSGSVDIVVPTETAKFWFWLEVSGSGAAVVRYGDDPTAESYSDGVNPDWTSTDPWSGMPVPDAAHIPIGWVDTNTHKDELRAVVRQLLRSDVETVGSGGAMLVVITGLYGTSSAVDYFKVIGFNGTDQYGSEFYVAKSLPSRMVAGYTVKYLSGDVAYTCTYTDDNHRISVGSTGTEDQLMTPQFTVGQWTYVMPVTWSMISKDGTELKWVETSTEREWTCPQS